MKRLPSVAAALFALLLLGAQKKDEPAELEKLQGAWASKSHHFNGVPLDHRRHLQFGQIIFDGEEVKTLPAIGISGRLKELHPRAEPKRMVIHMDYKAIDSFDGVRLRPVYSLDGDTLTICFGPGLSWPPAKMLEKKDVGSIHVYERVKPKAK